jgi:hypothetical protein
MLALQKIATHDIMHVRLLEPTLIKVIDIFACNLAVIKAVEESDCDFKMIERVTIKKELPGALWHIYRPWEADKIRDLLNKVSLTFTFIFSTQKKYIFK